MHHLPDISYLAVIVAAVSGLVIGRLWYGVLFERPWRSMAGITKQTSKDAKLLQVYALNLTSQLLIALALAALLVGKSGALVGLIHGSLFGLALVATSIANNDLFEQRPLKLWLINACYHVVNLSIMGGIITSIH